MIGYIKHRNQIRMIKNQMNADMHQDTIYILNRIIDGLHKNRFKYTSIYEYNYFEWVFLKEMYDHFYNAPMLKICDMHLPLFSYEEFRRDFFGQFLDLNWEYITGYIGGVTHDDLCYRYDGEGSYEFGKCVLEPGDVVIDCGANIGLFSALASAKKCSVYAFEPSEYIINNYLSKTAEYNSNISIIKAAVSDEKGTAKFKTCVSLADSQIYNDYIEEKNNPAYKEISMETVPVLTIDELVNERALPRVDFIKADIEGYERKMLIGAKNTIKKYKPKLSLCDYHYSDDPEVLKKIIIDICPEYEVVHNGKKTYAYCTR